MRTDSAARMTMPWQTTSAGSAPASTSTSAAATRSSCCTNDSPPGNAKSGSALANAVEQLWRFGVYFGERAVRPVAGVGLHQPRILARLQSDPRGDRVGRFACAQQRAAPQRGELVGDRALGQLCRLRPAGLVERHLLLALEAALEVVGRAAVAGEIDRRSGVLSARRRSFAHRLEHRQRLPEVRSIIGGWSRR